VHARSDRHATIDINQSIRLVDLGDYIYQACTARLTLKLTLGDFNGETKQTINTAYQVQLPEMTLHVEATETTSARDGLDL
jgi:transcriptional antiterminator Rof (Rho-off)